MKQESRTEQPFKKEKQNLLKVNRNGILFNSPLKLIQLKLSLLYSLTTSVHRYYCYYKIRYN